MKNFYGLENVDAAEARNEQMIQAVSLAMSLIGDQPHETIIPADEELYQALKAYKQNLQTRF